MAFYEDVSEDRRIYVNHEELKQSYTCRIIAADYKAMANFCNSQLHAFGTF